MIRENDLTGAWITIDLGSFDQWLRTGEGRVNVEYQVIHHDATFYTIYIGQGQFRAILYNEMKAIKSDGYQPEGFVPTNNVQQWLAERNALIRFAKSIPEAEELCEELFGPWDTYRQQQITAWEQKHPKPEKLLLSEAVSELARPSEPFVRIEPEGPAFPPFEARDMEIRRFRLTYGTWEV